MALISELTAGTTATNETFVPVEYGSNNYKFPIGTVTYEYLGEIVDNPSDIPTRVMEIISANVAKITPGGCTILRAMGWSNQTGGATIVCHRCKSHSIYDVILITMYIGAKMYFGHVYLNNNTIRDMQFTTTPLAMTLYTP